MNNQARECFYVLWLFLFAFRIRCCYTMGMRNTIDQIEYEGTMLIHDCITLGNLEKLAIEIGFKYDDTSVSHNFQWIYVHIQDSTGMPIGRLTFQWSKLFNVKSYKSSQDRIIDESDYIFMRLNRFLHDGTMIHQDLYEEMVKEAQVIAVHDLSRKLAWRAENPPQGTKKNAKGNLVPKTRKAIQGRNKRVILCGLINEFSSEF